jgi:hypothetical protein
MRLREIVEQKLACPLATQDLAVNTENRDRTIKQFNYGPLNVDEPGDYWKDIGEYWKTTEEAAKASNCGNCVAFDISKRMKDCLPGDTFDEDGELGYCWMHHFKCHSARSCHTWAKGGPIEKESESAEWQGKAFGVSETASAGSTASGNIATVANPQVTNPFAYSSAKKKPKKQKPTDNALDMKGTSVFGGPMLKR